jgi:hypothetical protein
VLLAALPVSLCSLLPAAAQSEPVGARLRETGCGCRGMRGFRARRALGRPCALGGMCGTRLGRLEHARLAGAWAADARGRLMARGCLRDRQTDRQTDRQIARGRVWSGASHAHGRPSARAGISHSAVERMLRPCLVVRRPCAHIGQPCTGLLEIASHARCPSPHLPSRPLPCPRRCWL